MKFDIKIIILLVFVFVANAVGTIAPKIESSGKRDGRIDIVNKGNLARLCAKGCGNLRSSDGR